MNIGWHNIQGDCPMCNTTEGSPSVAITSEGRYVYSCRRESCDSKNMDKTQKADMARRLYVELDLQGGGVNVIDDDKEVAYGKLYESETDYIDDVAVMSDTMYNTTKSFTCERFDKADNLYKNYLLAIGIKDRDDVYLWYGDKGCYVDFILKDIDGGWCGFKRRVLGFMDGKIVEGKFHNEIKSKMFLLGDDTRGKLMMYGLANVTPIGDIYLVEGEKDAAIMSNAVGAAQASAMGDTLRYLIETFPTHKIKVIPDNDKTLPSVKKQLNKNNHNRFRIVHLPRGIKDIGEYYAKYGDYEKEIDNSKNCVIMANDEDEIERSFDIVELPEKKEVKTADSVLFQFDKAEAPAKKERKKPVRVKKEKTLLQMIKTDDFVNAVKTFGADECFNLLRTENE